MAFLHPWVEPCGSGRLLLPGDVEFGGGAAFGRGPLGRATAVIAGGGVGVAVTAELLDGGAPSGPRTPASSRSLMVVRRRSWGGKFGEASLSRVAGNLCISTARQRTYCRYAKKICGSVAAVKQGRGCKRGNHEGKLPGRAQSWEIGWKIILVSHAFHAGAALWSRLVPRGRASVWSGQSKASLQ
jgi:hypothetical protein